MDRLGLVSTHHRHQRVRPDGPARAARRLGARRPRDRPRQRAARSMPPTGAHLLTFDSVHGRWDRDVRGEGDRLTVDHAAFNELDVLSDKLALPDAVVEKTAYIYRKVQKRGLVRGRKITALMAASAYIACREIGIPRTLRDIASASDIKRKHLAKAYRLLLFELNLKVPLVDQIKCIAKIANIANLSEKTKRQAISIMNEVRKDEILLSAGKNPMGLAVLLFTCRVLRLARIRPKLTFLMRQE